MRDTLEERVIQNEITQGVPVLMLANKQDCTNALQLHEIQTIFNQIAVKLEARDSKVMGISALEGSGVKEAVEWICQRLEPKLE